MCVALGNQETAAPLSFVALEKLRESHLNIRKTRRHGFIVGPLDNSNCTTREKVQTQPLPRYEVPWDIELDSEEVLRGAQDSGTGERSLGAWAVVSDTGDAIKCHCQ